MYYSAYLFSLALYIGFKLLSNNYDPFLPTDNVWHYILEEVIQVSMVTVYVLFAAQTLEVVNEKSIVRTLMYVFFVLSFLSICYHVAGAIINGPGVKSHQEYAISRISLVGIATLALLFAWRIRTAVFQRTIIIGSLVYDAAGLVSIISFTKQKAIVGLHGVEPYLLGCLLDIIIFSSALGYRLKTITDQKNDLLKKEAEARLAIEKMRSHIALNLHNEVGSVLSSMSIYAEATRKSLIENRLESVSEYIEKIGIDARETINTMSDIVWNINPVNDNGTKLFSKMEGFATTLCSALNIDFKFVVADDLYSQDFMMPVRQNIFLIFKEALHNCVQQSDTKIVAVHIYKNQEWFVMEIKADAKILSHVSTINGARRAEMITDNGLSNLQQRAIELGGIINTAATITGTKVTLQFLNKQYLII